MTHLFKRAFDAFLRDKDGRVVVWQFPNIPLIIAIASFILERLFVYGQLHDGFNFVGQSALMIWAYLEITDGASYYRRLLGAIVTIVVVLNHFM